ncbi:MAG TPA: RDD family protein [Dongiaceae bacterium]|nr:RDD family protein [Dongiaceae bacterium]
MTSSAECAPVIAERSQTGAKIIEFPRFVWGPPTPPPDQLAEPVVDRPRILEVPEVAPPPPALGGITIETVRVEEPERRVGIDFPVHGAPLARRALAAVIDGLIIGASSAVFGFIFWKITLVRPPRIQILSLAGAIPAAFWAVYQYLLIVYAGATPGLRLARLQLSRFDGSLTNRSLRRWRVLAVYLSAASLGMGYIWLFLDEDSLCWHDRITRTYLGPRTPSPKTLTKAQKG